jgi:hypothetical protein
MQVKRYTYWLQLSDKSSTSLPRDLTTFFWSSKIMLIAVLSLGLLTQCSSMDLISSTFLVDSSSWRELESRTLPSTSLFALLGSLNAFLHSPQTVMNFIATLGDPAAGALLGLPSLQRKHRIHCRCNCTLLELLILPCSIVHKSSDITLFLLPFKTNKILL